MKILVIGAGIAGCALGLALSKAGIGCKLVDLKPAPTAAGEPSAPPATIEPPKASKAKQPPA